MTAAHCVSGVNFIAVFFGAITQLEGTYGSAIKYINVTQRSSIIGHPDYIESVFRNDIALVKLPENAPIEIGRTALIPLPVGVDATMDLVNRMGTVSGFGRYSDASEFVSAELNYVTLPILANSVCATTFGSASVTAANICLSSANRRSVCGG